MDFLPVNSSLNQRLQYTQSYLLPQQPNQPNKSTNSKLQAQASLQNHAQNNNPINLIESQIEPIPNQNKASAIKIRQDIDDYIKRRSKKQINESSHEMVNRSSKSFSQIDRSIKQPQPHILQSKVEKINLSSLKHQKRSVLPLAETNDDMQLPVIKQTAQDQLDSSRKFDPLQEIIQSRKQQINIPLQRKLEKSNNFTAQSQVRSYVQPQQQSQSLQALENISETLNSNNAEKHKRNIKKYQIYPIIENEKQSLIEPPIKQEPQNMAEVISIDQISSNSYKKSISKQMYKRNLIQKQPEEQPLLSNSLVQVYHQEIQRPIHQQKQFDPIVINNYLDQSINRKTNHPIKRNLQLTSQKPIGLQSINIQLEEKADLQKHKSIKPLERSLVIQQPKDIKIEYADREESLKNSAKIMQKRELQRSKLEQSIPIQIQQLRDEDSVNMSLKSSLKRNFQPIIPKDIQVEYEPSDEKLIHQRLSSSLRRNLTPPVPQGPINVQIEQSNEILINQSLTSSLRRQLQPAQREGPILVQLEPSNEHSINQSLTNSLRRHLQPAQRERPILVQLEPSNEHSINQSLTNSLRRQLEPAQREGPIKVQLQQSNQHLINSSLKSSLSRHLKSPKLEDPVKVELEPFNEKLINESLKSSLKRNLEKPIPQQPINVQLQSENQRFRHQTRKSTLKRSLEAPIHQQSVPIQLEESKDYLSSSVKNSLKRNLQVAPRERSFKPEVEAPIFVELQESNEENLHHKLKSSLKRNLDPPKAQKPIQVYLQSNDEQWRQKSKSMICKRSLEHYYEPQQQIEQLNQQKPLANHFQQNQILNDSIHLSERLQTIESPKNITPQRRDLKINEIPRQNPELSALNEVSQQVIQSSSIKQLDEPVPIPMKKSIHVNCDPYEEMIKNKAQLLAKRNLKVDTTFNKPVKTCQEGWNPTKHIFNLFKIPQSARNAGQISFTKNRISTASYFH